jgi:predicted phage terminase large subunit-like protein
LALAAESTYTLPPHVKLIDRLLVRVAAGELKRLIVTVPVRHGKSEMCSRFFPAWLLGMRPEWKIVVAGYGQEFADEWGRKARDLLEQYGQRFFGIAPRRGSRAKAHWTLEGSAAMPGGGMYALGVGASLTGRGANVLVIDDPIKNAEEADSETMREAIWNWYWSTARTRLEPGGAVVILMARWHEDDLVGRLLEQRPDIEPWNVVNLPCLAEENDPLGRAPGETLWPERWSQQEMEATRDAQPSARWWSALYQQKPVPAEGLLFKRANFCRWELAHDVYNDFYVLRDPERGDRHIDAGQVTVFQVCDIAASDKTTADYTVVSTFALTRHKDLILLTVERQHFDVLEVHRFIEQANDVHGRPPIWVEEFGAGMGPLKRLRQDGYPAMALKREAGIQLDKTARAFHAVAAYEDHRIYHPIDDTSFNGSSVKDWENELATFPNAAHDDQVDTVSYAARLIPQLAPQIRMPASDVERRPITAGAMSTQF